MSFYSLATARIAELQTLLGGGGISDTQKFDAYRELAVLTIAIGTIADESIARITNSSVSASPIVIKTVPADIYSWTLINPNAATVYLKCFDTATPTVGTTVPTAVIPIPSGDGTDPGFWFEAKGVDPYYSFSTALAIAVVTGLGDTSNTAPTSPAYISLLVG